MAIYNFLLFTTLLSNMLTSVALQDKVILQ